ncbi:diguanylate cyclase [Leeia oryzae]|uniref:diguanylate cyclase n=1 Tax=Leeia oryzae TaxID=356662 RepID=UPI0014614A30|nr:diguanylate cyclase [Leeia oryzae]
MSQTEQSINSALTSRLRRLFRFPKTIRASLYLLIVVSLLPVAIGIPLFASYLYKDQTLQEQRSLAHLVNGIAQVLDRDLLIHQRSAESYAGSRSLAAGDFVHTYKRAKDLEKINPDTYLYIADATGQELISTLKPFGSSLPQVDNPAQLHLVFKTGRSFISGLYYSSQLGKNIVSIDVPVMDGDKVKFNLGIGIKPDHFNHLFNAMKVPEGYIGAILDQQGFIISRSVSPDKFIGKRAVLPLLQQMQKSPNGDLTTTTLEGISSYGVYQQTTLAGWTVIVGAPVSVLHANLWSLIRFFCLGYAVLLLIGFLLSRLIGGRISREVQSLVPMAVTLGEGKPVMQPELAISEVKDVACAMQTAASLIHQRTEERDRAKQKEKEAERLRHLAVDASLKDALTGLANRRLFDESLLQAWNQCLQNHEPLSIIMVDVDHFKAFNDYYGHQAGDECLKALAKALLTGAVRQDDVVARYGGEEFVVILPQVDLPGALRIAQRMQSHVNHLAIPHAASSVASHVTISAGVTTAIPVPGENPLRLVTESDAYLYMAKGKGRNSIFSKDGRFPAADLQASVEPHFYDGMDI